ncbi:MAG: lysostaphin resistance A-like protein, partial [Gemmatimonadales bacterium]
MTAIAKARSVLLAAVIGLAITAYGQGLWGVLVFANLKTAPAIPWAPALMVPLLAVMVVFLAGVWPRRGAATRRRLVRLGPVSRQAFLWSMIAGGCGVAALSGVWIVLTSLVKTPPNLLVDLKGVPVLTLAPILIVSILAAPITEEIAFRGYALGVLERAFTPAAAIVVSSTLFALVHLTQGLYPTKLVVYFLAGLAFALIAWRTGSLLPAMIVHSAADLTFFTLVWP